MTGEEWWRSAEQEAALARTMKAKGIAIIEPGDVPAGWGYGIDMTIIGGPGGRSISRVDGEAYVCADRAGWLPGSFASVAEAMARWHEKEPADMAKGER